MPLLQNTETRAENASRRKLNAIADALVGLMDELGGDNPNLRRSRDELTAAVGIEHRESTKREAGEKDRRVYASLRASSGSSSVGTDGPAHPAVCQVLFARSEWRFRFSRPASSSTLSACARLMSASVRLA